MMDRDVEMKKAHGTHMSIAWYSPFRDEEKGISKAKGFGNVSEPRLV